MTQTPAPLHSVAWRELFPWAILFRSWKTALSPSLLFLGVAALFATHFGWSLAGKMFGKPGANATPRAAEERSQAGTFTWPSASTVLSTAPLNDLIRPLVRLSDPNSTIAASAYHLLGWVIAVAVWSFAGGVAARWTILTHGAGQETDIFETGRFVGGRYLQFFLAPLAPLGALVLLGGLLVPIGWLLRFELGILLAALLWIGVLLTSVVGAWLMVGLLGGLPLMWGVLAAQKDADCLQAFSDAFSYVFGRPLHYVGYALLGLGIAAVSCTLVDFVAGRVVQFGYVSVGWGAGKERMALLSEAPSGAEDRSLSRSARESGAALIRGFMQLPWIAAKAYQAMLFFVISTTIFLLLRRDVDDKETNDVYVELNEPPPRQKPAPGAIGVVQNPPATPDANSAE
jgi:hypothetical protein